MSARGWTAHILNPSSHRVPWARLEARSATARRLWVAREHPEHTETLLDWALREGAGRLVVWGGDGTFHRVVKGLWKRQALDQVELALVPAGTCNDLARRFGLTRDLWRRWEAPSPAGRLAALSLGRVAWTSDGGEEREEIFINNAGFGRPRASFEKKEPPWGVIQSFSPIRLSARWADGHLRGLYYMALACNAPYFSGGLHFEKEPSPEDGLLRTYFVPASSKTRLALRLLRGRLGFPLMDEKTTRVEALKIAVDADVPVWPQADGEPPPPEGARRVEFSLRPEKVRFWVPA
jgi:diacylglycerol kinase family enzyme